MKRIVLAFVLILIAPAVCAAEAQKLSVADQEKRKALIADNIKDELGDYGATIVNDPKFIFEERLVRHYQKITLPVDPKAPKKPQPPNNSYDYVVSISAQIKGAQFMKEHELLLSQIELQFAIPKYIVTGILDAESKFGEGTTGDYPIVRSLLTIAVFRPDAHGTGWAQHQLISFLRTCRKNDWKPFERMGSRTGAWGKPQFEPTSYEDLAMHFNGKECESGKTSTIPPDMMNDNDMMCSIGNYLRADNWGGSEERCWHILHLYNRDDMYCNAIFQIVDFWKGRFEDKHHHYPIVVNGVKQKVSKTIHWAASD